MVLPIGFIVVGERLYIGTDREVGIELQHFGCRHPCFRVEAESSQAGGQVRTILRAWNRDTLEGLDGLAVATRGMQRAPEEVRPVIGSIRVQLHRLFYPVHALIRPSQPG